MVPTFVAGRWRSLLLAALILGATVLLAAALGRAEYVNPTSPPPS